MLVIYKFLLWFVISFPIIIFLNSLVPQEIIFSFIISLAIAFIAVKEDDWDGKGTRRYW